MVDDTYEALIINGKEIDIPYIEAQKEDWLVVKRIDSDFKPGGTVAIKEGNRSWYAGILAYIEVVNPNTGEVKYYPSTTRLENAIIEMEFQELGIIFIMLFEP